MAEAGTMRLVMLALSAGIILPLFDGQAQAAADPPPFKLVRFDEDYAYLRNDPDRYDLANVYKYISLDDAADIWLTLGGELRERVEAFSAPRFGIGARDDVYDLQRLLLSADLHIGDRLRLYGELGLHDVFSKDLPHGANDQDGIDAQLFFGDLELDPGLTLRVGRQELLLNPTQRFISVREGPNVRQSFDGVRLLWSGDGISVTAFAFRPVAVLHGPFDDKSDSTQEFLGAYASIAVSPHALLDLYAFQLDRRGVSFVGRTGNEDRTSLGARLSGNAAPFDYEMEGLYQLGTFDGLDIHAWALSVDAGYTLDLPWTPRLGVRVDAGSGDGDSTDGSLETFNPLFPKAGYFNEASLTSWSNLVLLRPSIAFKPLPDVTFAVSALARWRETPSDGVYIAPSTLLPGTSGGNADWVGMAYQFDATWTVNRYLSLTVQGVAQSVGEPIRAAGGRQTSFGMFVAQFKI